MTERTRQYLNILAVNKFTHWDYAHWNICFVLVGCVVIPAHVRDTTRLDCTMNGNPQCCSWFSQQGAQQTKVCPVFSLFYFIFKGTQENLTVTQTLHDKLLIFPPQRQDDKLQHHKRKNKSAITTLQITEYCLSEAKVTPENSLYFLTIQSST